MDRWYGRDWRYRPSDGPTIAAGEQAPAAAIHDLLELARNIARPALTRASAAHLARDGLRPQDQDAVAALLRDPDPGVRAEAVALAVRFGPAECVRMVAGLLTDPLLLVRCEAALALVDAPDELLSAEQRAARRRALDEHIAAQQLMADVPAGNCNLGNLFMRMGDIARARVAYERAILIDPRFTAAYVNLADLERAAGSEREARKVLDRGLAAVPGAADLSHALGLWLVRSGDRHAAIAALERAARAAPEIARYAYVHAVSLQTKGPREALEAMKAASSRHPKDPDILGALASMSAEAGDVAGALAYARRLGQILPGNSAVERLIQQLVQRAGPGSR